MADLAYSFISRQGRDTLLPLASMELRPVGSEVQLKCEGLPSILIGSERQPSQAIEGLEEYEIVSKEVLSLQLKEGPQKESEKQQPDIECALV